VSAGHGRQLEELVRLSLLREYGPVQLAGFLGLGRWQLDRALTDGLVPGPDTRSGKWSSAVAREAAARLTDIRAAVGTIPDLGAVRAAEVLTQRLGTPVTCDGVTELARRGLIPVAGHYKGFAVYDGRALEAFTDAGAAMQANRAGRLQTAGEAAEYLRIRRADLGHLIRAGLLTPAGWAPGPFDGRDTRSVPCTAPPTSTPSPPGPASTGMPCAPDREAAVPRWLTCGMHPASPRRPAAAPARRGRTDPAPAAGSRHKSRKTAARTERR
jgi:hypothetical protein